MKGEAGVPNFVEQRRGLAAPVRPQGGREESVPRWFCTSLLDHRWRRPMLFMAPPCESEEHHEGQAQRHALPRFDEVAVMPVTFLQLLLALSRKMVQTSDDRARRARSSPSCVPELASVAVGQETESPRQEVPSHLLQANLYSLSVFPFVSWAS